MGQLPFIGAPFVGLADPTIERVVASRNAHLDLSDFTVFTQAEWLANVPKRLVVPAGVVINGDAASTLPALRSGATAFGGTLEFRIDGQVNGFGGAANSGVGGTGLAINSAGTKLTGTGIIRGGGGGGGKGGTGGGGNFQTTVDDGPTFSMVSPSYQWSINTKPTIQVAVSWAGSVVFTGSNANQTSVIIANTTYFRGPLETSDDGYLGYAVSREYTLNTATIGGTGGAGGRGQGGDGAQLAGSAGIAGGVNAGAGGTGGTGGTYGNAGGTGATGASGNSGAGSAGTAGGAAGAAIRLNSIPLDTNGWHGTTMGAVS